jgi:hypothetical protein
VRGAGSNPRPYRDRCALVVPVFDGSGLYNVRFTDIKPETLSADDYQNFTGPTRLCEVSREEIRVDQDDDTYRRGRIWYARLTASDLMLPVRMEFDIPVQLAQVH